MDILRDRDRDCVRVRERDRERDMTDSLDVDDLDYLGRPSFQSRK